MKVFYRRCNARVLGSILCFIFLTALLLVYNPWISKLIQIQDEYSDHKMMLIKPKPHRSVAGIYNQGYVQERITRAVPSDLVRLLKSTEPPQKNHLVTTAPISETTDNIPITTSEGHALPSHNITKVLLFTYYRSGSSFLGEVFNNNKDVFYWFEPLAGITDFWGSIWPTAIYRTREWHYFPNGTRKHHTHDRLDSLVSTVENILNCDLDKLPMTIFLHFFMSKVYVWDKSIKMRPYKKCTIAEKSGPDIDEMAVRRCLHLLIEQCQKSVVRVVKTIRMTMEMLPSLLEKVPDVNVIHQARDPRGILNSWWRMFHGKQLSQAEIDSRLLCSWLLFDLRRRKELSSQYPNTFHTIQYEELATHPLKTVDKIYKSYLQQEVGEDLHEWVWRNTHASSDAGGAIGTTRENSTQTAYRWRKSLSHEYLNMTNSNCKEVILELGYEL